jgi:hypothetical protein
MQTGTKLLIRAGTADELRVPTGDWLFVDIGFAASSATTGMLLREADGTEQPDVVTYGALVDRVVALAGREGPPLHAVVEAPLSAAFDEAGNPCGRALERRGTQQRYWYCGPAPITLAAALFLLQAVVRAPPRRELRLFEGFVTFKPASGGRGKRDRHLADARTLRDLVFSSARPAEPVTPRGTRPGRVVSLLELLGQHGEPPLIVAPLASDLG